MLNSLYLIFIQPIEFLLTFAFWVSGQFSHSASTRIIILSLLVSILLIPIYNLFDYWQNGDRIKEKAMQPKLAMIKRSFKGQERFAMLKTVYHQFGYHPIYGVRNSLGFLLQIPFFIAAYQFLSNNPEFYNVSSGALKNLSQPDQLIKIGSMHINALPIIMTVVNLFSGFIYSKNLLRKDKIQIVVIALVFLVLLYNTASALVLYWTFNNVFSLLKNVWHNFFPSTRKVEKFITQQKAMAYFSAILFITIAFLYFPAKLLASDPTVFEVANRQTLILSNYFSLLVIGLFFVYVIKYFFSRLTKVIDPLLYVLAIFALVTSVYNIFDTGSIDHFEIANLSESLGSVTIRLMVDLGIILLIIASYVLLKNRYKSILVNLGTATVLVLSVIMVYKIPVYIEPEIKMVDITSKDDLQQLVPEYIQEVNEISSNHPNIIVLMLDGFSGQHVQQLMKMDETFKDDFSGFTWYSNMITSGNVTYTSENSIVGGHESTAYEVNKRSDSVISLTDEIEKSYVRLANTLKKDDYAAAFLNIQFGNCKNITAQADNVYCTTSEEEVKSLNPYYLAQNPEYQSDEGFSFLPVNIFGIFYSAPYSVRDKVYAFGEWADEEAAKHGKYGNVPISNYAFLDSLIDLFKVTETAQPTYKFLATNFTHVPYFYVDKSCHLSNRQSTEQIYNEYCAMQNIKRLITQLKDQNAYDNTMIILVSDHNFASSTPSIYPEKSDLDYSTLPGRALGLLMIKDFNQNAPLKESNIFLSNADVPSIICSQLTDCTAYPKDPRIDADPNRQLIHTFTKRSHPDRHFKNSFNLHEVWRITGSIHDRKNWELIETYDRD